MDPEYIMVRPEQSNEKIPSMSSKYIQISEGR